MGIKEIIERLSVFTVPALLIVVTVLAILFITYLWRKKSNKPQSSIQTKKIVIGSLLIAYLFVVVGLTSLSRGEMYRGSINLNLFSGYIDAWHTFSVMAFQLIIFNIIMFVPLGILLPLFSARFQKFKWVLVASFLVTILIELFQLTTGRGIFELDDIFHNAIGGVLGYHLYMLSQSIIMKKKLSTSSILQYLSIPIIFLITIAAMLCFYQLKEFGNMSINPVYGTNMTNLEVSTTLQLKSEKVYAPIYKNKHSNNLEHGRKIAKTLQNELKLPSLISEDREGDNRQFAYNIEAGTRYYMTYFKRDGTWSLLDDYYNFEDIMNNSSEDMKQQAISILKKLDILPNQGELTVTESGAFYWTVEQTYPSKDIENGYILLELKKDGSVAAIYYDWTENTFVREVELLSLEEAYEKIADGKFDEYIPFQKGDQLIITDYKIDYMYDSKGYFQPVYHFFGTLNGEEWSKRVTAIK